MMIMLILMEATITMMVWYIYDGVMLGDIFSTLNKYILQSIQMHLSYLHK